MLFALAGIGWAVLAYLLVAWRLVKTLNPKRDVTFGGRSSGDLFGVQSTAELWRTRMPMLKRMTLVALAWAAGFTIAAIVTAPSGS